MKPCYFAVFYWVCLLQPTECSIVKIPPKVLDRFVDGSMGATRNRSIREPNQLNLIELDYSFYLNG